MRPTQTTLPAPDDPAPRSRPLELRLARGTLPALDDFYSDRVRCDHPAPALGGEAVGRALAEAAGRCRRGRVVALCDASLAPALQRVGYTREATLPGFYGGSGDCAVMGLALDPARAEPGDPGALRRVDGLLQEQPPGREHTRVATCRATVRDAPDLARLIASTFDHYPTPSGVPGYVAGQIEQGIPFRVVRAAGRVVSCASADLVRQARTAELTDCATLPEQRGRGLMQSILLDLMGDLRRLGYPTAFTLSRAVQPGVNLAFQRLGFEHRGRMIQSCRIGRGLEDMNVWSRPL